MASQRAGGYAFIVGIILAVVLGIIMGFAPEALASSGSLILLIMIILGLIVGFMNIKDSNITEFLIAAIAVTLVGNIAVSQAATIIPTVGPAIGYIFLYIVALAASAALVVGLKQVGALASGKAKARK